MAVCRWERRSWSQNNSQSLFYSVKLFFLISAEKKQEKNIGRGGGAGAGSPNSWIHQCSKVKTTDTQEIQSDNRIRSESDETS
jgi:hypothetical protein